jgi:thiamine biosynthesis protein ThiI
MNLENRFGSKIKRKVNLSKPDVTIFVEVKSSKAYVYSERMRGLGGLPYGVSGRVVSMISGGIDSPVASWLMMKRGCSVDFINFYTDEKEVKKVKKLVSSLAKYSPEKLNLHSVPYKEILKGIAKHSDRKLTCVLCKRLMYRISEKFAERVKAKALVTGENLGQVASQTLENLSTNSSVVSIPILRPLISMDKEETMNLAKDIGTFDISIKHASTCDFVPKRPATRAKSERTFREEEKIKNLDKLILKAIGGSKKVAV